MKFCDKDSAKSCHYESAKRPSSLRVLALCGGTKQSLYFVIILALAIKFSLFAFAAIHAPQGKLLPDSYGYLRLADTIVTKGVFGIKNEDGTLSYDMFRTPGYPLLLAIVNGILKIRLDGVVLLQIVMTLLAAWITYRTALEIDPRIALLSMAIILFDPPITIFSLTILTESLFLLLIAIFMLNFTLYLKHKKAVFIVLSAIILATATYVRPIGYYLGFAIFFFILYASKGKDFWKHLKYAVIFIVIVYSIIGLWQVRNYIRCHDAGFCYAERFDLNHQGLFKSYARNTDSYTQGMAPLPYYVNVTFRSLMSLMTRPGNFKYFGSDTLTLAGKVLGYPWMIFWLSGFIIGIAKIRHNIYVKFTLFITFYFIITSVGALLWGVSERLRVPMMPFIAIISAYGWVSLRGRLRRRQAEAISSKKA